MGSGNVITPFLIKYCASINAMVVPTPGPVRKITDPGATVLSQAPSCSFKLSNQNTFLEKVLSPTYLLSRLNPYVKKIASVEDFDR